MMAADVLYVCLVGLTEMTSSAFEAPVFLQFRTQSETHRWNTMGKYQKTHVQVHSAIF